MCREYAVFYLELYCSTTEQTLLCQFHIVWLIYTSFTNLNSDMKKKTLYTDSTDSTDSAYSHSEGQDLRPESFWFPCQD